MEILPDDQLAEILLRLPDAGAAIKSAAVCKRWHSLILNDRFITRFVRYHSTTHFSDFSILFNCYQNEVPLYQLSENQSEPYDLSHMPDQATLAVRATCRDWLLVARVHVREVRQYCMYNFVTKQWFALPLTPPIEDYDPFYQRFPLIALLRRRGCFGYSLVFKELKYKVVLIQRADFIDNFFTFQAAVFDPDTRLWTVPSFEIPCEFRDDWFYSRIRLEIVQTSNGTLHWLDGKDQFLSLVSFDPFSFDLRLVPLPGGGIYPREVRANVRIGVARDRLRVSEMHKFYNRYYEIHFGLKIWELLDGDKDDPWVLVHDVKLDAPICRTFWCVLAFDPSNGNAVYLVRENDIYRYLVDEGTYETRLCELPIRCRDFTRSFDRTEDEVARFLQVFTLVRPLWPTPIPSLQT